MTEIAFHQLDPYLGSVRYDDLHFRAMRQLHYLRPMITRRKHAADSAADNIFFDLMPILDAPDTKGIKSILPIESAGIARIGRFDDDDAPVEQSVTVGFVDEIIRESPQQDPRAELQYFFRKRKNSRARYDNRAIRKYREGFF